MQRFPTLVAAASYSLVVALSFWPFWAGKSLLNQFSDMRHVYQLRLFAAEYFKRYLDFPGWNPYILGGMPFLANPTNGDTFYPAFLLRLILPVDLGMTLGLMVHIVLAGVFTYLFLRDVKLEWGGAFVGGAAYMFTGQVLSLVTAGHDGKVIVSALLPLGFLFLYRAVTGASWRAYLGFGLVVGLSLLSPHVQLTYYALMAYGFFWLFLVVWSGERPPHHEWWHASLGFALGLVVGFALDAIQLLPWAENIPFTPRAAAGSTSSGWEYATSYSMPPEELLNVVWPTFSGPLQNPEGGPGYAGRNFLKYHSEYIGVVPLMLASFAFLLRERRRLTWFFVFLAGYGTLFALGGHTPFYRLPYTLLPMIKMTRAPSMIFVLVSFSVAVFAAFGTQAVLRREGLRLGRVVAWVAALGAGAFLAAAGAWKGIMVAVARLAPSPEYVAHSVQNVDLNYTTFTLDAFRGLALAALLWALLVALQRGRWPHAPWGLLLGGLVLLDLWSVERRQILFTPPASQLYAADGVVQAIAGDRDRFRVVPAAPGAGHGSQDNYLSAHGLRSVLGYQGNELHRYDELLGGKNLWRNLFNLNIWRLLAVKYVVTQQPVDHPALAMVGDGPVPSYDGSQVYLYQFVGHAPFASVVREALRAPDEQVVPTLIDGRFDPRRLLLVSQDAPVGVTSLSALPDSVPVAVQATEVRPGAFRFELEEPAPTPAYLFVSENYYPAWQARVDGQPAPVVRAQMSLMAVPLAQGSRVVELEFTSSRYAVGRAITLTTLVLLLGAMGYGRMRSGREGVRD